jgi:hypothetical protein
MTQLSIQQALHSLDEAFGVQLAAQWRARTARESSLVRTPIEIRDRPRI